ncbi:MAG: sodium-dependent bicarbonate transport family permease [Pirellulales bacterium]
MFEELVGNVLHNMFKPLLLFFYAGFAIPLLKVKFEFPKVLYQGLTMYLLLAIGWHGGEELAGLEPALYGQAAGFMLLGFCTNLIIGITAYAVLRGFTKLRKIDAATVAGYYGSDSAGTFVTCLGVLTAANIAFAAYMPVMLAIMEIPGCLVALYIVAKMRSNGMDAKGNMPGEPGYNLAAKRVTVSDFDAAVDAMAEEEDEKLVAAGATTTSYEGAGYSNGRGRVKNRRGGFDGGRNGGQLPEDPESVLQPELDEAVKAEDEIALRDTSEPSKPIPPAARKTFNKELLHEVFLNPGIYLLFAGILIGFISRLQGTKVIAANDIVFVNLFQGMLSLFLLEMGMTASRKLKDLKSGGWQFIAFALIAPNVFATFGMLVAHVYSLTTGLHLEVGTYVVFAVLCGAASYIAVPAVQRMAIPEASPTLPLAASLGVTFSYNVTIGIPVYMLIAKALVTHWT